jgi:hypothetical protein
MGAFLRLTHQLASLTKAPTSTTTAYPKLPKTYFFQIHL